LPAMYAAWYKVGPDSEAIDNTIGA
jgi:hypothetical protein